MQLPSKYLEKAVDSFASLPGIGKRTALRLCLHLLKQKPEKVIDFSTSFTELISQIKFCQTCKNIADGDYCSICLNPKRNTQLICVVEDIRDILAIESTQQFSGVYHVLGGLISPMDGIGPSDLNIDSLFTRILQHKPDEIIFALSTTIEGDTTNFYLYRKLSNQNIKLSIIARGIALGDELEYADELTLGRSIINRTPYEASISR